MNIAVLAVEFSNLHHSLSIAEINQIFEYVSGYYKENSFNLIKLSFSIYGWYRLDRSVTIYGADRFAIPDDSNGDNIPDSHLLITDAICSADSEVDFEPFDCLVVLHAGNGQESELDRDDIWSVCFTNRLRFRTGEKTFTRAAVVPERERSGEASPLGTICHEVGHLLGLPDLYGPSGQQIIGPWELMDAGNWGGEPRGSKPAGLSLWSRMRLGWVLDSFMYTARGELVEIPLRFTELIPVPNMYSAIKIPISEGFDETYYLAEARGKIGFDSGLPDEGVIIMKHQYGVLRTIDATPETGSLNDGAWKVGMSFEDTHESLHIIVAAKIDEGYKVIVSRIGKPMMFAS